MSLPVYNYSDLNVFVSVLPASQVVFGDVVFAGTNWSLP